MSHLLLKVFERLAVGCVGWIDCARPLKFLWCSGQVARIAQIAAESIMGLLMIRV